jgi:alpha-beta hydrolase superfamily lysophospholipase
VGKVPQYIEFILSAGLRLHLCIRTVDIHNPAILFIPGTGHHAGDGVGGYGPFLDALAREGFTVAGLDLRGHGKSEGPRGDFVIDDLLDDIDSAVSFLTRQGPQRPIGLLGSSQGGFLSLYSAARNPEIKTVCCHNAMLLPRDGIECSRAPRLFQLGRPLLERMAKVAPRTRIPTWSYIDTSGVFKDPANLKAYMDDPLTVTWYSIRALHSLASTPPARPLSEIACPTMIITGERDSVIPLRVQERTFADLSEPKRLVVIPDALHMLLVEYIEDALPPVVQWFRETLAADCLPLAPQKPTAQPANAAGDPR